MERTLVRDLPLMVGEEVTVCGWVSTLRLQAKMQFVIVHDHTGSVQVTNRRAGDDLEAAIEGLSVESAVVVRGRVVENPIVKLGGLEIVPSAVLLSSAAESPLPIDERTGPEQRWDWRFLDLRLSKSRLLFEVQTTVESAMREVAFREGFVEIHTPKLMGSASESGAEVFRVDYFDRKAYLAQSPQFYKQMAIAAGLDRVFEVGPVFRAEPSFTTRHATEFTGVDVEMAWIEGVEDVMAFEERMLAHVIAEVERRHGEAIRASYDTSLEVPSLPFPRVTMREAVELLWKEGWDPTRSRQDLDRAGEVKLSEIIRRERGHDFVFVTRFPVESRPFYHLRPDDDPSVTESFDLLWKGVEITTGAQREHRYDRLVRQAEEKGVELEPMRSYLNCFRFGTPPHGGFGLGLARLTMVLLNLPSIRDAMFLFRGPNRLDP
jgi:nondiscriminating aspartyl-tRNA synthetase